eukprot:jgi/Mesvir1/13801/Mv15959-RA.3
MEGETASCMEPQLISAGGHAELLLTSEDLDFFVGLCSDFNKLLDADIIDGYGDGADARLQAQNSSVANLASRLAFARSRADQVPSACKGRDHRTAAEAGVRAKVRLQEQLKSLHLTPSFLGWSRIRSQSTATKAVSTNQLSYPGARSLPNVLTSDVAVTWHRSASKAGFETSVNGLCKAQPLTLSSLHRSFLSLKHILADLVHHHPRPGSAGHDSELASKVLSSAASSKSCLQDAGLPVECDPTPSPRDAATARGLERPLYLAHAAPKHPVASLLYVARLEKELAEARAEQARLQDQAARLASLRQRYHALLERVFPGSSEGGGLEDEIDKQMVQRCRALALLLNKEEARKATYKKWRAELFGSLSSLTGTIYCMWDVIVPRLCPSTHGDSVTAVTAALKDLRTHPLHYGYYGAFWGMGSGHTRSTLAKVLREVDKELLEVVDEDGHVDTLPAHRALQAVQVVLGRACQQVDETAVVVGQTMEAVPEAPKVTVKNITAFSTLIAAVQLGYSVWLLETHCRLSDCFQDVAGACVDICKCIYWFDRQLQALEQKLKAVKTLHAQAHREMHLHRHELLKAAIFGAKASAQQE